MNANDLTQTKKSIAALALFGLTETLLGLSLCPAIFGEALRVVTTESVELKEIAVALEIGVVRLRTNVFSYLGKNGVALDWRANSE